jgi:hypothetical protein
MLLKLYARSFFSSFFSSGFPSSQKITFKRHWETKLQKNSMTLAVND